MRYLYGLLFLLITTHVMATSPSSDYKTQLKALYGKINTSSSPHTDLDIASDISQLMKNGCLVGANRALAKKNYGEQQKAYAKSMMVATCRCIADSPDLHKGVVDSALLLKKQGSNSSEAREAMITGMKTAKTECMNKIMSTLKSNSTRSIKP